MTWTVSSWTQLSGKFADLVDAESANRFSECVRPVSSALDQGPFHKGFEHRHRPDTRSLVASDLPCQVFSTGTANLDSKLLEKRFVSKPSIFQHVLVAQ